MAISQLKAHVLCQVIPYDRIDRIYHSPIYPYFRKTKLLPIPHGWDL